MNRKIKTSRFALISTLLLFSVSLVKAQQKSKLKVIDSVQVKCYYLFSKNDPLTHKTYRTDTMQLEIGKDFSRFFDPKRLMRDSILSSVIPQDEAEIKSVTVLDVDNEEEENGSEKQSIPKTNQGESYQIFKNRTKGSLQILDYINPILRTTYSYTDPIGQLDWEVSDKLDTLLGYNCQSAKLRFRGRTYTAWFSTEIPVNDGPWKFYGLPGLILKVEDSESIFSFQLIGIKQVAPSYAMHLDDSDAIKCNRDDFIKLLKNRASSYQASFNGGALKITVDKRRSANTDIEMQ
jgi:GLPGLI family protein